MSPAAGEATWHEQIMAAHSIRSGDLAARFAQASRAARDAVEARSEREAAIRDVAAGVAAPALVGFVIWIGEQSRQRGLRRLQYLIGCNENLHARLAYLPKTIVSTPNSSKIPFGIVTVFPRQCSRRSGSSAAAEALLVPPDAARPRPQSARAG
jgi:hypothetical protein